MTDYYRERHLKQYCQFARHTQFWIQKKKKFKHVDNHIAQQDIGQLRLLKDFLFEVKPLSNNEFYI